MFFVRFASLKKWDRFAPFNFPVDCLDPEALLNHNEQYTFIRCIFVSLDSAHTQKKSFCVISSSLFVNNNHVPKITHMVRCIERNIKSSFSHITLITSIHLNIKTIMWNQVSCRSTESFCTHHAIIPQFLHIFKVGQVLSKTQRVYNIQCFFNLPFQRCLSCKRFVSKELK